MKALLIDRIGRILFRHPIYNIVSRFSNFQMPKPSDEPIDVIIPVISKDLQILPYCLEGLRINILNRVKDIYIIGPKNEDIIEFARRHNLKYVEETSVLGISPKDINYITIDGKNRSGWLFQQFLKLSGNIGECENFLTIDSDHILLKPHVFLTMENKFVFYRSQEFHWQYIKSYYKLLGDIKIPLLSFISHKMIFNKTILSQLKESIEIKTGKNWIESIIRSIDRSDASSFSEFELYGNFVPSNKKQSKLWLQKAIKREGAISITQLEKKYSNKLSVTLPEYLMNGCDSE